MTMHFRELADQAAADGRITPDEILGLRREGWSDGTIQAEEAEALFVINDNLTERSPEWIDAFIEAIVEYLVAGGSPRGYIGDAQGDWLISQLDHDGRVESMAELELLGKLFEKASFVPQTLKSYALHQIEQAVLTGCGPTRDGGRLDAASVTEAECRLLRRFIFAQAGDCPGVSQAEAEMMFRIKDATLGASNAPEWPLLFVQGVGNYLQAWSDWHEVTPERARELEVFMNDNAPSVGRFFGRMATTSGIRSTLDRTMSFGRKGVAQPDHDREVAAAGAVTPVENAWMQSHLDADGKMDDLEHSLLVFIGSEPVQARG